MNYKERTLALAKYLKVLSDTGVIKLGTPQAHQEFFEALAEDFKKISEVKL